MKKICILLALAVTACSQPASALVLTQPEKEIATLAYEKANGDCRGNGNDVSCNVRAVIGSYLARNNVCFESQSANHREAWRSCTADEKKFWTTTFKEEGYWNTDGGPVVTTTKLTAAFLQGKRAVYDGPVAAVFSEKRCGPSDPLFFDAPIQLYGNYLYVDGEPNTLVLPWTSNVVLIVGKNGEESFEDDGPVSYMLAELC